MKAELLNKFILNPSIETYIPLYNLGIKMFERYGNAWHEVKSYKSDFSDIKPHHFIYNSPNVEDIGVFMLVENKDKLLTNKVCIYNKHLLILNCNQIK